MRENHTNKYINRPKVSLIPIGFPASCPWRPVSQETTRARRCALRLEEDSPRRSLLGGFIIHIIIVHVLRVGLPRVFVVIVIVIILFMARVVASGEFLAVPLMLVPVGVVYRLRHQRLRHPRQRGVLLTPM